MNHIYLRKGAAELTLDDLVADPDLAIGARAVAAGTVAGVNKVGLLSADGVSGGVRSLVASKVELRRSAM